MRLINRFIDWSKEFRQQAFLPLFKTLASWRITPNRLTFFRALGGPLFVFLFVPYPRFTVSLAIFVSIIDWIDGGLARYLNIASDRGKFWDVLVDHSNYVFGVFALLYSGFFSVDVLAYHLLIVPILYLLATIKESEYAKTDWIIHPYYTTIYFKPLAIAALFFYVFFSTDYVDPIFFVLNIAMTLQAMYFMVVLTKRWGKKG